MEIIVYILCAIVLIQVLEIVALIILMRRKQELHFNDSVESSSNAFAAILDAANKKSETIVQNAVDKAEDIIYQSQSFRSKIEKEMKYAFEDGMKKHAERFSDLIEVTVDEYKNRYSKVADNMEQIAQNTYNEMKQYAKKESDSFTGLSAEKVTALEDHIRSLMEAEMATARIEIQAFKKQELDQFSSMIKSSVLTITKDVLRLSIPKEEQEKLVFQALEKAKTSGLFGSSRVEI
jgi:hypothetical protein